MQVNNISEEEMIDRYQGIGYNISEYRRQRGYTQAELAEKIDISSNYLSQIERGRRKKYSIHVLVMISEALDVPLRALFK